jgi:hypothetical protein
VVGHGVHPACVAHTVQASPALGMSLQEAGAYLGIPAAWMDSWGRFRPDDAFPAATPA